MSSFVEELKAGRSIMYFTVGSSMEPLLKERRTQVLIEPVSVHEEAESVDFAEFVVEQSMENRRGKNVSRAAKSVKRWDVLLYRREDGRFVLHRLIKRKNGVYYTRGDNTYTLEAVRPQQILGKVTAIYRNGSMFEVEKRRRYRWYVRIWSIGYPMRKLLWKMRRAVGRIRRVWRK